MRHSLEIRNDLDELRPMSEWLHRVAGESGVNNEVITDMDLCANEAVTNVINYGYDDDHPHPITLSIERENQEVRLEIVDDAVSFNPLARPDKPQPESIEETPIGGLGIPLIRRLTSTCDYVRRDSLNVFTLHFRLR